MVVVLVGTGLVGRELQAPGTTTGDAPPPLRGRLRRRPLPVLVTAPRR